MTLVTCYIVVLSLTSSGTVHTPMQVPGVVRKESGSKLYVDFSQKFRQMKVDNELQPDVQWINENDCLYTKLHGYDTPVETE